MRNKWSEEYIETLKENYANQSWDSLLSKLHPFSKQEITRKASKLKIRRNNTYYTNEEIEILTENYSKMTVNELIEKYFPHRTRSSIETKANNLGLASRKRWTDNEIDILRLYYDKCSNDDIAAKYLPDRTVSSLVSQAEKMGLKKEITNKKYKKYELIDKLKDLADEIKRTPSSEDILSRHNFPSLSTYVRYFGSYSNACKAAGLDENRINIFGNIGYYISSDNTVCLSKAELIVTEALIRHNIAFQKEVYYKDFIDDRLCGNKRCDWLLKDGTVIEYFGMPEKEHYKKKMKQKQYLCAKHNVNLISLYRKHLYNIDKIVNEIKLSQTKSVTTTRQPSMQIDEDIV